MVLETVSQKMGNWKMVLETVSQKMGNLKNNFQCIMFNVQLRTERNTHLIPEG